MANQVVQGILAINKPRGITSAAVLRKLETRFDPSELFAPWLKAEKERLKVSGARQKVINRLKVRLGHGGTLDPLATGVLIVGVGGGTKSLSKFIECTKSYEAVLLFGCATDSYDSDGKVVARAPYKHLTQEKVEEALAQFRGKLSQKPPVFSALKVNGKKLYEYARSGAQIPEIKSRDVSCLKLDMTEWMDGGSHSFRWPKEEAPQEEKVIADKLVLKRDTASGEVSTTEAEGAKRKREETEDDSQPAKKSKEEDGSAAHPAPTPALDESAKATEATEEKKADAPEASEEVNVSAAEDTTGADGADAPAVRLRMTVTSGFYVRSLCHDLGQALGSLGIMTALVRSQQAEFSLGENVLDYELFDEKEDVWAPKVKEQLEDWTKRKAAEAGK